MIPLPQTASAARLEVIVVQSLLQPFSFGGSQRSPGSTSLFPHEIVDAHSLGSPWHSKYGSSLHAAEQPSPLRRAPSSHSSLPTSSPSPQMALQPLVEHCQPSSTSHAAEQPSPSVALP